MIPLAALAAGLAVLLVLPGRRGVTAVPSEPSEPGGGGAGGPSGRDGPVKRFRWLWAALGGAGVGAVLGGPLALPCAVVVAAVVWRTAGRVEAPATRRRREEARRDLPHLVTLLGAALASGAAPGPSLRLVSQALPGPAADDLLAVATRLDLGGDPAAVWAALSDDPALGPLGRTLARSHRSGAPVAAALDALADDLARRARAEVEDRARAVGVRAAVPLGVCLLPAFLLLGIVPVIAGLAADLLR